MWNLQKACPRHPEVEFIGNAVPQYWQSFDNLEDPRVTSTGFLYFNVGEKPDKVQFALAVATHSVPVLFTVTPVTYS